MPAPPAESTPMARISPAVLVMNGTSAVPTATSSTPTTSTRPAPMRSATIPASGCVRPHHSWPKAKARLMLAMPSPVWVLSAPRKRPIDWRAPIVSAKVPAAASSTSQRAGATRDRRAAAASVIASLRGGCRLEPLQAFVDQRVQPRHPLLAQGGVERELRLLPGALRLGALGAAGVGRAHQAAACVGPGADARSSPARRAAAGCASGSRRRASCARPGPKAGSGRAARHARAANTACSSARSRRPPRRSRASPGGSAGAA